MITKNSKILNLDSFKS